MKYVKIFNVEALVKGKIIIAEAIKIARQRK